MGNQDLLKFIIEIHAPDAVIGAMEGVDFCEITDIASVEVMLYSGDAAKGVEAFNVYTDVRVNPRIFEALRDYFSEDATGMNVWRIEFKAQRELVAALGLSLADLARQYLREIEIDIMNLLETDGDDGMLPDLPCPWCLGQTDERDEYCPSCGHRFG